MFELVLSTTIGLGAGPCDIQGSFAACDNGGWVSHVYAKTDVWRVSDLVIGIEYRHFSRPEKADLDSSLTGTGAYDYGGVYIEYQFDWF